MKRRPYSSERSCSLASSQSNGSSSVSTCFSYQSLAKIARRFNEANPDDKITLHRSRDKLWREIQKRTPECNDERCWIRSRFIPTSDRNTLLEDFKPPLPKGKYDWLNTDDIEHVLKSYERVFRKFVFLGAYPIDFQTVYGRKFNPLDVNGLLQSGKRTAGLVLNLDRSDQPGSHWVAIYLDLQNRVMEYYDSYGVRAGKHVKAFLESLSARDGKPWIYKENRNENQRKDSECGVYSIHFIVRRLTGTSFERVVGDIIRDDEMNRYRAKYFDPYEKYDND